MKDFLTLNFQPFGLDISDFSLKVAQLEKKKLVSFSLVKLPEKLIEQGEIKDKKELSFLIKKATQSLVGKKLKTKFVSFSLPEEKVLLNHLEFPLLTDEELNSAIFFELENRLPIPLSQIYVDWIKLPSLSPRKIEILTVAISKKIVEDYVEVIKNAGFFPLSAEPESFSVLRIAQQEIGEEMKNKSFLILDLGEAKTIFIFIFNFFPYFTFSCPISGTFLTKRLTEVLNLPLTEAESLKRKIGLKKILKLEKRDLEEKVFEILIPPLVDLSQQAKKFLAFFNNWAQKQNLPQIQKIYLCGGGSNLKGITNFLKSQLGIEVEKIKLKSSIIFPENLPISEEMKLSFLSAFSLAQKHD